MRQAAALKDPESLKILRSPLTLVYIATPGQEPLISLSQVE